MRRNIVTVIAIALLFLLFPIVAIFTTPKELFVYGQIVQPIYDVSCPLNTSVLNQALNPVNGHLKAYLCVNQFGDVTSPNISIPVINPKSFGAVGDAQSINDGVTSSGANATVTSVTANWPINMKLQQFIECTNFTSNNSTIVLPVGTRITQFISTTVVQTNGTSTGAASGLRCIIYTQDDTASILAAYNSAVANVNSVDPNNGPWFNPPARKVYVTEGGYYVSGRIYAHTVGNASPCPDFIGADEARTIFYMGPNFVDPNDGGGILIENNQCIGGRMGGFYVDGGNYVFSWTHGVIRCFACNGFQFEKIKMQNLGSNSSTHGVFEILSSNNVHALQMTVENAPGGDTTFAVDTSGSTNILFQAGLLGNHNGGTIKSSNNPFRSTNGGPVVFEGMTLDECGTTLACNQLTTNGQVTFNSDKMYASGGATGGCLSVDGTSQAVLNNVSCGIFGSSSTAAFALNLSAGSLTYVSMSHLYSNGTSLIANGPSTATLVDVGGNQWQNCVNAVCSAVTASNFSTLGFSLTGVFPKATVTHTPNTCYAVTGNLLATAQNLCQILLDQNYSVVNITAQSGGTTPANSSCATPPVITLSDGTRSATLTMTSGKTAWSSSVDAVTNLNQIFASNSTLTISIGSNTCATPPVNVSVNYVLQSVLNP